MDTIAAIAAQLAGSLYGASWIPRESTEKIAWQEVIQERAMQLIKISVEQA